MIDMYGIAHCDTIKKARKWLDEHQVEYCFHDYKKEGVDAVRLQGWCAQVGWEALLNKRGTTWRKLPEEAKDDVDEAKAIGLLCEYTSMIKRPVLDVNGQLEVGFSAARYAELFA
ncbi:MAG: ArsC family reductase [Zetaproteobacteria bacterium CG_4_9_14_3_um_filter_49_83]|nr:MAG: arsenate reductase [Zetaproteobacteria bacterium CG1_02_49_23]PIQ33023.1 MAG: ArsC family reductase [Zetaproteobacteria bacterium CG17_big_fil_post_rev_8_21_14_2_50_50_13]PIV29956.1 MAG: ArsC family reductase [Zetaproteobacteria bacterium CG02_land_8_20_14_3_00_50_9]PIY55180.1 MAG: ArsC family reductase [Zetaproteobacteria bacterium CG_4_10_14_0_8_um_filter_49_80]PJA35549.1 MAG: ArsC family reductase [Zetaproteobacteria bacterium CG_4_9_14_3_um_filter_49_83]